MLIIVCGGRDYLDARRVNDVLDALRLEIGEFTVIEGGATGADHCAQLWALARKVPLKTVHADWNAHGRAAGPIRNKQMLELGAQLVIAFPGGRGTANMMKQARAAGVAVREIA